jgi:prephenate dehydrogenase
MPEPDRLPSARVAILGLGLMGGSLALALRGRCASILGYDPDPATLELARRRQVVDLAAGEPGEILPQAEVVILAAPVGAIIRTLTDLPRLHPGRAIVLDLGSTKSQVTRAMAGLPDRFDPIGGHPMCGKETSSLANAEATLFQGATFAFTPLERTTRHARALAAELARAVGSTPLFLDPQSHDRWVAATSHVPYLLAAALALATPGEAAPLAGPGFRSATRVAAASPAMMIDVLRTNRNNILEALAGFRLQLDRLEADLAGEEEGGDLSAMLERSAARRSELLGTVAPGGRA